MLTGLEISQDGSARVLNPCDTFWDYGNILRLIFENTHSVVAPAETESGGLMWHSRILFSDAFYLGDGTVINRKDIENELYCGYQEKLRKLWKKHEADYLNCIPEFKKELKQMNEDLASAAKQKIKLIVTDKVSKLRVDTLADMWGASMEPNATSGRDELEVEYSFILDSIEKNSPETFDYTALKQEVQTIFSYEFTCPEGVRGEIRPENLIIESHGKKMQKELSLSNLQLYVYFHSPMYFFKDICDASGSNLVVARMLEVRYRKNGGTYCNLHEYYHALVSVDTELDGEPAKLFKGEVFSLKNKGVPLYTQIENFKKYAKNCDKFFGKPNKKVLKPQENL